MPFRRKPMLRQESFRSKTLGNDKDGKNFAEDIFRQEGFIRFEHKEFKILGGGAQYKYE